MNSQRYFIFRESACCAACGLEGTVMVLEQNPHDRNPHFNLYAVEDGKHVLMTKDHVLPKAFGGEEPGRLATVVAFTDSDNTGLKAEAWYGDLAFLPADK